jgi:hypothetical protein
MGSPCIAFTDEWVELKVGLICSTHKHSQRHPMLLLQRDSRLAKEFSFPSGLLRETVDVKNLAAWIGQAEYLVTDKSLARVLAYAMGIPTCVVEPSEPRHNPVFDPPASWRKDTGVLNGFDARGLVEMLP